MSRPRVVPAIISRRSRLQQPTLDICAPAPKPVQLDDDFSKRVQARIAQRAAKVAAANLAATKVPRVPRVARWPARQHAPTLESKESSLKAIRYVVPARSDKSSAVQSTQPRNEPAGRRPLAPRRPTDFLVIAPMAPRATRFRAVDDTPLAFSPSPTPKVALKSILRKGASRQKRRVKKVSFGEVETKEVKRWIGIVQGTEADNALVADGMTCRGKMIHIHPDPCRIVAGKLVGWSRRGDKDDWNYLYLYGQDPVSHCDCPNPGCNRNLWRVRRQ